MKNVEQTIIGIALRDNSVILKNEIDLRWFKHYRKHIEEIIKMVSNGVSCDAMTLHESMPGSLLSELVLLQTSTLGGKDNFKFLLDKLKNKFVNDGIKNLFSRSVKELEANEDVNTVLNKFLESVSQIKSSDHKNHNYNMNEAMTKFVEDLEKTMKLDGKRGLKLGFKKIDHAIGGIQETDLMVVGARPGVGKTAFAVSVIMNICKKGKRVGFFSTEMSVEQVMARLVSMESSVDTSRIRDAKLEDSDWKRIQTKSLVMKKYNLNIYDKPSITPSNILLQSRAWQNGDGLDLIIVDYLTRLKPDVKNGNQNLEIGDIVSSLKNTARTLKVPVIVLAQLNRDADNRAPRQSDLRDSGIIEQEADQILLLYRPSMDKETSALDEIIIDKNRHGRSGKTDARYVKEFAKWEDVDGN